MKSLGLEPTYNSGSSWIEKEDGQNDFIICQLKSTDAQSIKINQKDIRILEKNANIEHKLPVFAIQFLNTNEVWLMIKPDDVEDVSEYLQTGKTKELEWIDIPVEDNIINADEKPKIKKMIKSSGSSREKFHKENEKKYDKTKSAK